jgi:ketosteroid isomerase-like protein
MTPTEHTRPSESRRELFALLDDPETVDRFFEHVADDVRWTVMGTHPLAGTYESKHDVRTQTFGRLRPLLREPMRFEVEGLHGGDEVTVAELATHATAIDGAPFDNTYCWVCRFDGDVIVEVRAYLDSALVADTVARLESGAWAYG